MFCFEFNFIILVTISKVIAVSVCQSIDAENDISILQHKTEDINYSKANRFKMVLDYFYST